MDILSIALGLLFTFTLIYCLSLLSIKHKNLPPGPTPLPIIGNLHLLRDHQTHISLAKLAKTYGPIMKLHFGQITTIVISSPAMAKEVLLKLDNAFCNRSIPDAIFAEEHFKYSALFLPPVARWRSLRKIMNSYIFSSTRLNENQEMRSRKVQELIAYCNKKCESSEVVEVGQIAFRTTLNMLSNNLFSTDVVNTLSDAANEFERLVISILRELGKPNMADFFPSLKIIDPQGIRSRSGTHFRKLRDLLSRLINKRLEQNKSHARANTDLLDVLLDLNRENPEEMDSTQIQRMCGVRFLKPKIKDLLLRYNENPALIPAFNDLFIAGTDSMSTAVEWAMAETLRNPEIMKKAKSELHEIVGEGKIIKEADIPHLTYLQCIVKETLRLHPPAPLLIPRRVDQDVELCGYTVPKNSQVLVNAWAIGRDAYVWLNPLEFNPERFLDSKIDVKGHDFELIPFGAGRRMCPGLSLAVRILPVMLGSMLNLFEWKLEGGIEPKELDMDETFGIVAHKTNPLRAVPKHVK